MESEGVWGHLLEAVTPEAYLTILDRYEVAPKGRYPSEIAGNIYPHFDKGGRCCFQPKDVSEIGTLSKKIKRYPGGAEWAAQLAREWRIQYGCCRAVMDEPQKAKL